MKLGRFMDDAYHGRALARRLETRSGDMVFGLEDLADRVGLRPGRAEVESLAPVDAALLARLIATDPGKKFQVIWGLLTSIAAERSSGPLHLPAKSFAGLELCGGSMILEEAAVQAGAGGSAGAGGRGGAADHLGERMSGGRIMVRGRAGDYLGQEMSGGGIVAKACGDYAFRNMRSGFGAILGDGGKFTGLGNSGGRIVVRGSCKERAGWLMRGGSLRVRGDAGEYLGLLMSGGEIRVAGKAGKRAGWRMKGGRLMAGSFGPEAADCVLGLD